MYCPKCGNKILPRTKFCTECGAPINTGSDNTKKSNAPNKVFGVETVAWNILTFGDSLLKNYKRALCFLLVTILSVFLINQFFGYMFDETTYYRTDWDYILHCIALIFYYLVRFFCVLVIIYTIGPSILTFILGGRRITREDDKQRILPLLAECMAETKSDGLVIPDTIEVYIAEQEYPNLIATGRNTICITRGMMELDDNLSKAFLYDALFRISRRDVEFILAGFLSSIWSLIFLFAFAFVLKIGATFYEDDRSEFNLLILVIGFIIGALIVVPLYISLKTIYSETDFKADEYVCRKGFGEYLCAYLDYKRQMPKPFMCQAEDFIHKSDNERIGNMQRLGINY